MLVDTAGLRKRARVNQMMDWFNTGLYRDFGYGFVYPQIFPQLKFENEAVQKATLDASRLSTPSTRWTLAPRRLMMRPS